MYAALSTFPEQRVSELPDRTGPSVGTRLWMYQGENMRWPSMRGHSWCMAVQAFGRHLDNDRWIHVAQLRIVNELTMSDRGAVRAAWTVEASKTQSQMHVTLENLYLLAVPSIVRNFCYEYCPLIRASGSMYQ